MGAHIIENGHVESRASSPSLEQQQQEVSPGLVVQALMARISALTYECAMKDAYIMQLQGGVHGPPAE